jgi:hypothetical protein
VNELKPFYKLLGIPEDTARPTAYQFLGLDPADAGALSWENVQAALASRKKLLRQNIPSREFIPVVSVLETKLEKSAEALAEHLSLDKRSQTANLQAVSQAASTPQAGGGQEPMPIDSHRFWLSSLRWVLVESRELYDQARRRDDLPAATEALRMSLEALKLLRKGRDDPGQSESL